MLHRGAAYGSDQFKICDIMISPQLHAFACRHVRFVPECVVKSRVLTSNFIEIALRTHNLEFIAINCYK